MIVAVAGVRVVEVTVDEIVDVIAVRHRVVSATWAVGMVGRVGLAGVRRRACRRIRRVDGDHVFVVVPLVGAVQVTIVQVVDVVAVSDRDVTAAGTVYVRVIGV